MCDGPHPLSAAMGCPIHQHVGHAKVRQLCSLPIAAIDGVGEQHVGSLCNICQAAMSHQSIIRVAACTATYRTPWANALATRCAVLSPATMGPAPTSAGHPAEYIVSSLRMQLRPSTACTA